MNLIDELSERLRRKDLPGISSHKRMRPRIPGGGPIRFPENVNPVPGAVLILLYREDSEWYFPLIQRPTYDGVHSGQIGLPGGKKEPQDRDLTETALREAREEIGIIPEKVKVLGALSPFLVAVSNHDILPVVAFSSQKPQFVPDTTEVAEVIESPLSHLLDPTFLKERQIVTQAGIKLDTPYFDIGGKVVWGATAAMLSEFVDILTEINSYKNP